MNVSGDSDTQTQVVNVIVAYALYILLSIGRQFNLVAVVANKMLLKKKVIELWN